MLRDIIIFFAGAEAFHALSHIFLAYAVKLPVESAYVTLTPTLNFWGVIINGAISIALLCLAGWMKRK